MARRVFLHVGTQKSGTSYLRSLWWQNRDLLAARGLLLPGSDKGVHFRAASVVCDRTEVVARMDEQQRRAWDLVVQETAATASDALIGQDQFSRASVEQADRALRRLEAAAEEVHVLVTARDLARQLASAWQQDVKEGSTETLADFWERADREGRDGAFWTHHDLPALLDRWSQGIPPERVHLVVLPQPGAPRDWLWHQVCAVTGVDPDGLDARPERSNDSLGIVEVEVLRRLYSALPAEQRDLDTVRFVKGAFTRQVLVAGGAGERFALPAEMHAWAVDRAADLVAELRRRPWHVVGDLADLLPAPQPAPGRTPDQVTADEVADVAVRALGGQLLHGLGQRDRLRSARTEVRRLRGDAAGR